MCPRSRGHMTLRPCFDAMEIALDTAVVMNDK